MYVTLDYFLPIRTGLCVVTRSAWLHSRIYPCCIQMSLSTQITVRFIAPNLECHRLPNTRISHRLPNTSVAGEIEREDRLVGKTACADQLIAHHNIIVWPSFLFSTNASVLCKDCCRFTASEFMHPANHNNNNGLFTKNRLVFAKRMRRYQYVVFFRCVLEVWLTAFCFLYLW